MKRAALALLAACVLARAGVSALPAAEPPEGPRIQVAWRAWDQTAFAEAQRLNRPVFLWIYAPWSSASAAMALDVFGDEKAAALLNERFVPVRVDLDRRPDIDRRHQQAVQALGGTAGWPLTAILSPEGHVIYGGTFFTLEDDFISKRPGLRTVLNRAAEGWRTNAAALSKEARALEEELRKPGRKSVPGPPPEGALDAIGKNMQEALDPLGGGFGPGVEGPKYPTPLALELALALYARGGGKQALAVATQTLDGMLAGGIFDQIGGGFHRFARDRRWRIPRFEKLLAVDAEMLPVLIHAWQATGNESYAQAAQATLAGYDAPLLSDRARGGFYASVASDEAYYTWTVKELEAAVADDRTAALAARVFEIGERGDLPESAPYRNVIFKALGVKEAAQELKIDYAEALKRLLDAQTLMLEARNKRPAPFVDNAILVDANARMVSAYLLAAEAFGRGDLRAFALKTLDRLLAEAVESGVKGRGAAHVIDPGGAVEWTCLAADDAALALAGEDAYAATGAAKWLDAAKACLARLEERFLDKEDGAYFDRAADLPGAPEALGRLGDSYKPYQDAPTPSANAMAALANLRMTAITCDPAYAARGRKTLDAFGPLLEMLGGLASSLPLVTEASQRGLVVLVIVGEPGDPRVKELRAEAARYYAPHKLTLYAGPEDKALLERFGITTAEPAVHILSGKRPAITVTDASKLKDAVAAAAKKE